MNTEKKVNGRERVYLLNIIAEQNAAHEAELAEKDRREIENRLLTRRKKDKTTLREQLDARRHMEALRAYQSEVRSHDKLAGAAKEGGR